MVKKSTSRVSLMGRKNDFRPYIFVLVVVGGLLVLLF